MEIDPHARYLDLGCDDGSLTDTFSKRIRTKSVYGVDIIDKRMKLASLKNIVVKKFDLNGKFDFKSDYFDVISANQVIEHIIDIDRFVSEIFRVLKFGGYAVVSTENASSWHNIFASIMGWQIFSLTNFSSNVPSVGNPLSMHRNSSNVKSRPNDYSCERSWNHIRILNFFGLKEYFERCGFMVEKIYGAGYYPFPAYFGNIDKIHSHFITFKLRKIRAYGNRTRT